MRAMLATGIDTATLIVIAIVAILAIVKGIALEATGLGFGVGSGL